MDLVIIYKVLFYSSKQLHFLWMKNRVATLILILFKLERLFIHFHLYFIVNMATYGVPRQSSFSPTITFDPLKGLNKLQF